ncbi:MAG TPA: hypothetical protein VN776_02975 [Terracidiphilus sp.]|nr:hypothetical protein [Terracidiphilus sp.]
MIPLDDALRFGGFVLVHAAWIASDLEAGELVCPFGVVEIGDSREVIPFEAPSQEEAIRLGKQKMHELTGSVDRWAFAREGLWSILGSDLPKQDVLTVSAWSIGLDEPVILQQRFSPKSEGNFTLLGPILIVVHGLHCTAEIQSKLLPIVSRGISQHPRGENWSRWESQ